MTNSERFWSKVAVVGNVNECWFWKTSKDKWGYGKFRLNGKSRKAHRVAYEFTFGDIPGGLPLDHLCSNRDCENPWHLDPVTVGENIRRGQTGHLNSHNARKTHCARGHEFTPENIKPGRGLARGCRACHRQWKRRSRAKVHNHE